VGDRQRERGDVIELVHPLCSSETGLVLSLLTSVECYLFCQSCKRKGTCQVMMVCKATNNHPAHAHASPYCEPAITTPRIVCAGLSDRPFLNLSRSRCCMLGCHSTHIPHRSTIYNHSTAYPPRIQSRTSLRVPLGIKRNHDINQICLFVKIHRNDPS
jgi:hypothetical protein